jgi:hypothetical protein
MFFLIFPRLVLEFILDIFYFPLWWYTNGIVYAVNGAQNALSTANTNLAPFMWLKNLFVPMFGQHDFQGRMVSVIMRFLNFIFRGIALFIWTLIVFVLLLAWVLVPLGVLYMLIVSLAT